MKYRFSLVMSSVLITALVVPVLGQTDWPTYGHDAASTHYSPLKQIDTKNVTKLTRSWTFHMNSADSASTAAATSAAGAGGGRGRGGGGGGGGRISTTPIVAGGVMYLPTPNGKVVALEPETGEQIWVADLGGTSASTRGLEYWGGDNQSPPTLFFGTSDGRLMALNAKTGKPVSEFGNNGSVNMKTKEVDNGAPDTAFSLSSPVKVYKNVVITGARVQEGPRLGYAGDDRAWDIHTGIAATNDRHFRAFESKTGKVLWDVKLEAGGYATPITYQGKNGKQYVAIIAGGGGYYDRTPGDSVIAFALP
jgi:quinoprotein glucose dehydrogenase